MISLQALIIKDQFVCRFDRSDRPWVSSFLMKTPTNMKVYFDWIQYLTCYEHNFEEDQYSVHHHVSFTVLVSLKSKVFIFLYGMHRDLYVVTDILIQTRNALLEFQGEIFTLLPLLSIESSNFIVNLLVQTPSTSSSELIFEYKKINKQ